MNQNKRTFTTRLLALAGGAASAGPLAAISALATTSGAAQAQAKAGAMRELTSTQLARQMGTGWNLGNSLEAIGGETAWGNPRVTQAFIDAVKAAGFKTIRIPVAWHDHADAQDRIRPEWLARVSEVVGYARKAGLYVMINMHWDGGWMQPTFAAQDMANARLVTLWQQIATHFRDHDDFLLFAGTNEVMVDGDWGTPKPENVKVQNGFNQLFVDTVRATGGNNATRHLVVQGFNTNIEHTLNFVVLPKDSARERLMMEVHFYDPYEFALDDKSSIWQWGAGATDKAAVANWGDEAHVNQQFARMKARFADRGVPVILGEFGVIARTTRAGSEKYREAWNGHVARAAIANGMVPVYWDNGGTGEHGMGVFDRHTGRQAYPGVIKAIVSADR